MLQFINDNAGALNLLFTAVVAIATVVYAVLTSRLVGETRRLRQVATEPSIEVTYRSRDEAMALLDVVVKNVGGGPAYKVIVRFSAEPASTGTTELLSSLNKVRSFERGISVLMPGQEFASFWTDVRQDFDGKVRTIVRARSSCRSVTGHVYEHLHQIDMSELEGVIRVGTPPLLSIAGSLKEIRDDLHKLASGFRKLAVNIYTQEDRDRIELEWQEHRHEVIQRAELDGEGQSSERPAEGAA